MDGRDNILIVSNNVISGTKNNGKTINSIFENYPKEHIRQLYFSSENPEDIDLDGYFQISDKDMVNAIGNKNKNIGRSKEYNPLIRQAFRDGTSKFILKNDISRLAREVIWHINLKKLKKMFEWLNDFNPTKIFFVGGDSIFAYEIVEYIQKKYNAKLITYITDDYILPRNTINIFWWIRRNILLKRMKRTISDSIVLVTISELMRKEYFRIFNKQSIILMNTTESQKIRKSNSSKRHNQQLNLIYAGGVHYNRYKILNELAVEILKINNQHQNKVKLNIYTNEVPTKGILSKLNIPGASEYCGSLNKFELLEKLNNSDIPVHVESFDKKSIESTRLSISTKISEYTSLEKPILAIGPENIASMDYLKDISFCITNKIDMKNKLESLFYDLEKQKYLSKKSRRKFEETHKILEKNIELVLNI